jgi:hypothetical protein
MVYEWKPMAIRSLERPQTRWENDVKNDLNTMKLYNWKDCSRTGINGKKSLRRPKYSMTEVVEPEEEEVKVHFSKAIEKLHKNVTDPRKYI